MTAAINLQRNSEVFFSTIDLEGGGAVTSMTPANTWKVEVLAGFALSQGAAIQDITPLEGGTTPDRSVQRFNTAINPVDWNFQVYLRPTGVENINGGSEMGEDGNVRPLADWHLWQALMNNVAPATGTAHSSSWEDNGIYRLVTRAASENVYAQATNYNSAQENYLYFKLDNVLYQVSNASINQATVDQAIDGIATVTWAGFGTQLTELSGTQRNNAVSVFGGTLNNGSTVTANSNAFTLDRTCSFHPWATYNVDGAAATASFIKNRLSSIEFHHKPSASGTDVAFTFPVTGLSFDFNNNISYLTPEELAALNDPIGQFTGARTVTGSATMYLRAGDNGSSRFLANILADARTQSAQTSNANLIIGGTIAPYVAFHMPAAQFGFPSHSIEDIISLSVEFLAQETTANRGSGDEVTIFVNKS